MKVNFWNLPGGRAKRQKDEQQGGKKNISSRGPISGKMEVRKCTLSSSIFLITPLLTMPAPTNPVTSSTGASKFWCPFSLLCPAFPQQCGECYPYKMCHCDTPLPEWLSKSQSFPGLGRCHINPNPHHLFSTSTTSSIPIWLTSSVALSQPGTFLQGLCTCCSLCLERSPLSLNGIIMSSNSWVRYSPLDEVYLGYSK